MWDNPDFLILFSAGNEGADLDADGVIDKYNLVFYSLLTLALLPWFLRSGYILGAAGPGLEAVSFGKGSFIGSFQNILLNKLFAGCSKYKN